MQKQESFESEASKIELPLSETAMEFVDNYSSRSGVINLPFSSRCSGKISKHPPKQQRKCFCLAYSSFPLKDIYDLTKEQDKYSL